MKNSGRNGWILLLVLLAGVLIGGEAWLLLLKVLPVGTTPDYVIGTASPLPLNLGIVDLTFGARLHINPGSVVGLIAGLAFYFWRR